MSASCHSTIALMVSGLSQMAPIIFSRPASMRLAMAISPSRERSSTLPISRRYMRTGSSVRPSSSSSMLPPRTSPSPSNSASAAGSGSGSGSAAVAAASGAAASSVSSLSITLMPISLSIAMVSSICSEETWSWGRTELSSS